MRETSRVLVVDDDPNLAQLVRLYLEKDGFEVETAARGDDALALFQRNPPDLMLLDVMLPGLDGMAVLKAVRRSSAIPVTLLTARDETFDKVLGLELGADDYITKPFDPKELVARVRAVLRRTRGASEERDETISFPGLSIHPGRYEVYFGGNRVEMSPKELELLAFLAAHPGQVFTREQLLENVWGFDFVGESTRTVDVHIKRLREKLPDRGQYGWDLATVWGVGYKFDPGRG